MAIVRDKILLPGFYWYDAPPAQGPGFHEWLSTNRDLVKVRKTRSFADDSVFGGTNAHTWALFEVIFPVPWLDQSKFGFPNRATKETESDVISSGAEGQKDPLDRLADGVKSALPFLAPVSTGVLLLGGLVGLGYFFRKEIFDGTVKRVRSFRNSRNRRASSA